MLKFAEGRPFVIAAKTFPKFDDFFVDAPLSQMSFVRAEDVLGSISLQIESVHINPENQDAVLASIGKLDRLSPLRCSSHEPLMTYGPSLQFS